jgi:hypothetical protein
VLASRLLRASFGWLERMMTEDLRALSPLIYHHINPYGTFELDMANRLRIDMGESLRLFTKGAFCLELTRW